MDTKPEPTAPPAAPTPVAASPQAPKATAPATVAPPAATAAPAAPAAPASTAVATAIAAATKIPETVGEAASVVQEHASELMQSSPFKMLMYVLVGVACVALLAFVLYWLVNRTVNKQKTYRFSETEVPLLGTQVTSLPADKVPDARNGKRQTFMFWIYIYDIDKFTGQYRHVWHRGDRSDNWERGSPAVYLDNRTNKLHITIGTESNDAYDKNSTKTGLTNITSDQMYAYIQKTRGITIDYVPLQRWVHIAVVVNEEVNNGTITAYVDGELVHVATSDKDHTIPWGEKQVQGEKETNYLKTRLAIQNSNLNKKGNIYVGGSTTDESGPGFSGMVSRIAFFNYDLNMKDIHREYRKGPVSTVAGKIGYGVRNPVYRVG